MIETLSDLLITMNTNAEISEEIRPKGVTWQLKEGSVPKISEVRTPPNRENISRRDQPTWYNCRMLLRHNHSRHDAKTNKPRVMSAPAVSLTSSRSMATSLWDASGELNISDEGLERGRELLRRRAKLQLRKILPTKYENFDAGDLRLQQKKRAKSRCKSAPLGSSTFTRSASEAVAPKRGEIYFINGVTSSAYRRPSVQINRLEAGEINSVNGSTSHRRYSEPTVRLHENTSNNSRIRRKSSAQFSAISFSKAPSTSAPATIASNDCSVKSEVKKSRPPYLEHDWRSEILSRYATEQPWVPRIKTTRYFPKFANLQDVNCRNPYLIPNGLLYNAT